MVNKVVMGESVQEAGCRPLEVDKCCDRIGHCGPTVADNISSVRRRSVRWRRSREGQCVTL